MGLRGNHSLDELIFAVVNVLDLSEKLTKEGSNVGKVVAWNVHQTCQGALRQIELAVRLKQIEIGESTNNISLRYSVPDDYKPPIFVNTCTRCNGSGLEP